MNTPFPTASAAAKRVTHTSKRDIIAEHDEWLGRIGRLIHAADCYCITVEVPNEHLEYLSNFLDKALYTVTVGLPGPKMTVIVIDFSEQSE